MKKILTLLLSLALLAGVFSALDLTVLAEDKNMIPANDSTFESGKPTWSILTEGTVSVVDNPAGEGKVLRYGDPKDKKSWSTPMLNVRKYIQDGLADGADSIVGAFDIYCEQDLKLVLRFRTSKPEDFSKCAAGEQNYCSFGSVSVTGGEWNHFYFNVDITDEDMEVKDGAWNFCFDNIWNTCESEIFLDNVYFGLEMMERDIVVDEEIPAKTPVSRGEKTLIGTIRWDAFTKTTPKGSDPASQVARVLSPAQYHGQAPFFCEIKEDGTMCVPGYDLSTWEAEAAYAVDGGLDYFAYLWYETSDAMSQPRKLHLKSEKKDTIKMAGVLETIRTSKTMDELWAAMQDSCYLRVNNRPVLFLYGLNDNWDAKKVAQMRQDAVNAGVKESLYIVGMSTTIDATKFSANQKKDIDAISWYSVGATQKDQPYASLAAECEKIVKGAGTLCAATGLDLIPAFTAGRDTRARIQTGVSWVKGDPKATEDKDKPYGNKYALPPTMAELQQHIENVLMYAKNETKACKTNLVCSYGWNEHEEGGWLCPTLAVDENGAQLYNADGTKKINTERLDALKAAIESVKNATPAPAATAVPTVTDAPADPTEAPAKSGCKSALVLPVLGLLIPAAIVVRKKED